MSLAVTCVRRDTFERVFSDDYSKRRHSAFATFTELAPIQDVSDEQLRRDWINFRAGWNQCAIAPNGRLS